MGTLLWMINSIFRREMLNWGCGDGNRKEKFLFFLKLFFQRNFFYSSHCFHHLLMMPFLISHAHPKEIPFCYSIASQQPSPYTLSSHKWMNEWRQAKIFFHLFSGIHIDIIIYGQLNVSLFFNWCRDRKVFHVHTLNMYFMHHHVPCKNVLMK